jgi:hypothetical protein
MRRQFAIPLRHEAAARQCDRDLPITTGNARFRCRNKRLLPPMHKRPLTHTFFAARAQWERAIRHALGQGACGIMGFAGLLRRHIAGAV